MKPPTLTNRKIGEFHNLHITGQVVSGTLIQRTGLGVMIDQIKRIFNSNTTPGNSFFIYYDPHTKHVTHKKINIADKLSRNAQHTHYNRAHVCLSEALFSAEEPQRNAFLKNITRIHFGTSLLKKDDIFNLGMIAQQHHGNYHVVFSQKEFIAAYELANTQITYGKKGMCHALALKWLAAQGTPLEKTIFTDLIPQNPGEIPAGREEIFTFSIAYNAMGRFYENLNADVSYPKKMTFASSEDEVRNRVKNMTLEEQKSFKADTIKFMDELTLGTDRVALEYMQMYAGNKLIMTKLDTDQLLPEHTGKYEVIFSSSKKGDNGGNHGVAIYIDVSASIFKFFDPNHGEFLFNTAEAMKAAIIKLSNYGKHAGHHYKIEYGYQFIQQ